MESTGIVIKETIRNQYHVPSCKFSTPLCLPQWWILGEANEAVASGPPSKIAHAVSIRCRCF